MSVIDTVKGDMPGAAAGRGGDRRTHEYVIPVDGMTCMSCVGRVEKALAAIEGASGVAVSLVSMTARVKLEEGRDPSALTRAILEAGYDTIRDEHDLAIGGMSCASCVSHVEKVLGRVPGVAKVEINLTAEKARVQTIAGLVDRSALIGAVEKAGYTAQPIDAEQTNGPDARRDLRRELLHFAGSALLSLPFVGNMAAELSGGHSLLTPVLQLILATPIQFYFGARFYRAAWRALRAGNGNMDLLVALGTSAAFGLSLALVLNGHAEHGAHLYFEASAIVITLILLGKWLEARAKHATGSAIQALAALRVAVARVLREGHETEVPIDAVRSGDIVVVRPAERVPVDGVIVDGETQIDESLITGESLPVDKRPGDSATGGSINHAGMIRLRATTVGSASRLSRIIRLVDRAQSSKAPIQKLVDRVSAVFVPVVVTLAVATAIGWWLATGDITISVINAVAVLVISCPCALGLATPAAVSVGIGNGARHGLLIRDADAFDLARKIEVLVFDKTGTLTIGHPVIKAMMALDGDEDGLLALVAGAQQGSEHPLARAAIEAAKARGLALTAVEGFKAMPGRGLMAKVGGRVVHVGNRRLMDELQVELSRLADRAAVLEGDGATVMWVAVGDPTPKLIGALSATDSARPAAGPVLRALRDRGIRTVMLTGDNRATANVIAGALGVDEVIAEVVPEMKAAEIKRLRAKGSVIAMVGDGINDAPALAEADVGIAMGTGTEAALEAAKVALMRDDLSLLPALVDLSRRGAIKIKQNLFWAFIYNLIGIPFAALGLLGPIVAGGAMAMSSVSVVSNALLLRRWRPSTGRAMARSPRFEQEES